MTAVVRSPNSNDINDPDDYTTFAEVVHKYDEYGDQRFQKFSERKYASDHSPEMVKCLFHGKYLMRWCDVPILKGPTDLITYQQMLQDIRPETIIETGTWLGASAAWFGDMAKNFGLNCHVYSMDIMNPDAVDKKAYRENVSFLHGDSNKLEETFTPQMMKSLPHPWLVVEDAHVNVVAVMEYFTAYMLAGDYLVMEDVTPDMPNKCGMGLIKDRGWEPTRFNAHKSLEEFMKRNDDKYLVDRYYCDMFGYNGNCNWNAYLKRI